MHNDSVKASRKPNDALKTVNLPTGVLSAMFCMTMYPYLLDGLEQNGCWAAHRKHIKMYMIAIAFVLDVMQCLNVNTLKQVRFKTKMW